MFQCHVCSATESHTEKVNEVFQINGKLYLVEQIPAQVCSRCRQIEKLLCAYYLLSKRLGAILLKELENQND
jgi:YgiT-type zinc finger domain-containing protein